jgi:hypothetical protein
MRIFGFIILSCISLLLCFGEGDHDKNAFAIRDLRIKLEQKSLEELKTYALKLENYSKGEVLGGLHDYINDLSKEDLIIFIASTCLKNKELLEENKFKAVVEEEKPEAIILGGLHDYIYKQDRKTLIRWALTGEAHEREVLNIHPRGGLHDYIKTLSDAEIASIVLNRADKFKELNSKEKLDALSTKYSISFDEAPRGILGGLHDYIRLQDRETLIKWALTAESHDRAVRNIKVLGGLHEMISNYSNEKIAEYVLDMAARYPELNSVEKLNALTAKYNITFNEEVFKNKSMKFLQQ